MMEKLYSDLSELDTLAHLDALCAHIDTNGWVHLYERIDYVNHLQSQIEDLKLFVVQHKATKEQIEKAINQIDKIHSQLMKTAGI